MQALWCPLVAGPADPVSHAVQASAWPQVMFRPESLLVTGTTAETKVLDIRIHATSYFATVADGMAASIFDPKYWTTFQRLPEIKHSAPERFRPIVPESLPIVDPGKMLTVLLRGPFDGVTFWGFQIS